jgi:general secretion pathway protein G
MSANPATRRSRGAQRGFTLIEIMVVVVIIGLLAAIIGPELLGRVDDATVTRVRTDISGIQAGLDLYRLDNHRYPNTEDGLEALVRDPGDAAAPNWSPRGYLSRRQVPVDPWGNPYQYAYPGQRGEFDLYSLGADGEPGGEGLDADIGNWDLD